MFYVDLTAGEEADEEDVISRSIKEIHQSAQKLSDNIERLSNDRDKFTITENNLRFSSSDGMSGSTDTVIEGSLVPLPSFDSTGRDCSGDEEGTRQSTTLRSNVSGDFDTPPETPDFPSRCRGGGRQHCSWPRGLAVLSAGPPDTDTDRPQSYQGQRNNPGIGSRSKDDWGSSC
jgi:hypothetical protein